MSGDVTKGMPFTYGLAAQVGAPETPEHLQQTHGQILPRAHWEMELFSFRSHR